MHLLEPRFLRAWRQFGGDYRTQVDRLGLLFARPADPQVLANRESDGLPLVLVRTGEGAPLCLLDTLDFRLRPENPVVVEYLEEKDSSGRKKARKSVQRLRGALAS